MRLGLQDVPEVSGGARANRHLLSNNRPLTRYRLTLSRRLPILVAIHIVLGNRKSIFHPGDLL